MEEQKQDITPSGRKTLKIALPIAVLIVAVAIALYLGSTSPKAHRTPPVREVSLVEVLPAQHTSHQVIVTAMGSVIPHREITLKSRVTGDVIRINPRFTEGGHLKEGEDILRIDDQDYRLALAEQRSAVVNAEYALKLELGQQDVAKREWEVLQGTISAESLDSELALRKPHLEKARADLDAAEAALKQAELDLSRTVVRAPFNCIVRTKNVDLGSRVSSQDALAELVGTDEYRVRASVPVDRLKWIAIPRAEGVEGSKARILYGNGAGYERTGNVVKLLGELEEEGRMARILITVDDPLDLEHPESTRPPLLIGEYVRLEIEGPQLDGVVALPRSALRDGKQIWIMSDDGTLDIRKVEIAWREEQIVLVNGGIADGERIVITDLSTPAPGMKVITASQADGASGPSPKHQ